MNKEVFWCKNCLNMSTRPRITFDDRGWCNACQWMEEKKILNWSKREKELKGERVKKLITFFQKMEPKKAAPMFEKMDKDLVISMFKEIPQKQITTVLEQMQPDKSVELSEYFGRVRSAREYDLLKEMNKSLLSEFEECKGMVKAPSE